MTPPRSRTKSATRRVVLAVATVFLACMTALSVTLYAPKTASADGNPSLYVFVNSAQKPRTLQQNLESKMPGVTITVFGRFRDFETAIQSAQPDAVLALKPVLSELGMKATIQGLYKASPDEAYVLIAVGKTVDPKAAVDLNIGSVDILGRTTMKKFVGTVLGVGSAPKVKLVTKAEDLLPLLQFGQADAVLLPERQSDLITGRSELDLKSVKAPNRVNLVAAAAVTAKGDAILAMVKGLDASVSADMGVDSWQ